MKQIVLLLFLFSVTAFADERDAAPGELVSRFWLEDPILISGTFGVPNHLFSLSVDGASSTDKLKNIDYAPPQATDFTLAIGWGRFNFAWKQPLPQSSGSKGTYGKHSYDDFSFEYGRTRFNASLYYQTFSGYYTDLNGNTGTFARIGKGDDTSSNSQNDAFSNSTTSLASTPSDILKRPDISAKHYGAIAWYGIPLVGEDAQAFQITFRTFTSDPLPTFNLDLVTNMFYDYAHISATSPFVPAKRAALFGEAARLQGLDTHSIGAGFGLASSFVFEGSHFFFDTLLTYGGGLQRQHAYFTDNARWKSMYVDNFNMRLGGNLRYDRHQAGLHFWVNTIGAKVSDIRFSSSNMAIELGYQITI